MSGEKITEIPPISQVSARFQSLNYIKVTTRRARAVTSFEKVSPSSEILTFIPKNLFCTTGR